MAFVILYTAAICALGSITKNQIKKFNWNLHTPGQQDHAMNPSIAGGCFYPCRKLTRCFKALNVPKSHDL
jgi:hypothetical protein